MEIDKANAELILGMICSIENEWGLQKDDPLIKLGREIMSEFNINGSEFAWLMTGADGQTD